MYAIVANRIAIMILWRYFFIHFYLSVFENSCQKYSLCNKLPNQYRLHQIAKTQFLMNSGVRKVMENASQEFSYVTLVG